jgi:outer membrane protein TolC
MAGMQKPESTVCCDTPVVRLQGLVSSTSGNAPQVPGTVRVVGFDREELVMRPATWFGLVLLSLTSLLSGMGCATRPQISQSAASPPAAFRSADTGQPAKAESSESESLIVTVSHTDSAADKGVEESQADLSQLELVALSANPGLRQLQQQVAAAQARSQYADKLPDPTVGANIFAHPIETAAGSQRANMSVMQMLPWLERLDAQTQQACFEAIALQQQLQVQRLKVVGDVRTGWYRLYVLQKQIELTQANQQVLQSLIDVANASVATGKASQGDVLLGTLEYSRLEEQLVTFSQQSESAKAELNRLLGRDVVTPVEVPQTLDVRLPDWSFDMLRQVAWERQPAIAAAHTQTQASRWGIEIARLRRRPDVSLQASWFAIDDNRPASPVVDVGRDAWSVGAQVSIPLWQDKYDAIEREARWKHAAAHASVEDVRLQYDSLLRDLWQQAQSANETAELYQSTILPQARQTLRSDQEAYANGTVEFDRVIRDFRSVLTLEIGYHKAVGQLAMVLARVRQAAGVDLPES